MGGARTSAAEPRVRRPGRPSRGAREALVEAARRLFMEREFDDVSTEAILKRSGVSRGALYHHFPSKADLFRAVWEDSERRLIARVAAETAAAVTSLEWLVEAARTYLRICETDEELRRIGLSQSRKVLGWEGWRSAAGDLGLGVVREGVRAAIESGELAASDVETTSVVLMGALIEAAMLIVVADDRSAARRRSEAVMVGLLEGLRR